MCEVLRTNFEALFPEIRDNILKSAFIAIDGEFTGLSVHHSSQPSLFDDPDARYKKLRKTAGQFLISQFGLCAFVESTEKPNTYIAYPYNFYLFPISFGSQDVRFLCQASSLEFLCDQNFDFNKFIYDGIPYLNESQEQLLRIQSCQKHTIHLSANSILLRRVDDIVKVQCSRVEEWLKTSKNGESIMLEAKCYLSQYMLLQELKSRFGGLHFHLTDLYKVVVSNPGRENKEWQSKETLAQQEEKIVTAMTGFSRVFKVLLESGKPLVGHNMLTDLLLMYEKFYKPLPESYSKFKQGIHGILPRVYDTKQFVYSIRRLKPLKDCPFLDSTNLEELHGALSCKDARFYVLYNPAVQLADTAQRYQQEKCSHEAGYDSYLTGYVFLRSAHLLAYKTARDIPSEHFRFPQLLEALKPYENQLAIGRASCMFLNLAGPDPPSNRPQWFYVTYKGKSLSAQALAQEFARFGSVDVKLVDDCHALVAVAQHRRAQDVLKVFRRNKRIQVKPHNAILDSPTMQTLIRCGGVVLVASSLVGLGIVIWKIQS